MFYFSNPKYSFYKSNLSIYNINYFITIIVFKTQNDIKSSTLPFHRRYCVDYFPLGGILHQLTINICNN